MAVARRKALERREPTFAAKPAAVIDLKLDAHDRLGAPVARDDGDATAPVARKSRRAATAVGRERGRADPGDAGEPVARRKAGGRGGGRRPRSLLFRLLYWTVVIGLWGMIIAGGMIAWVAAHLPPIQSLEVPKRPPAIEIVGIDGHVLAMRGDMGGAAVPLKQLPPYLPQAFIAIEDRRFYSHHGIDPIGILRAVLANISHRGVAQGGSTLTQQLAKNLFLTQERTLQRKLQEVVLAVWIEHKFSKAEILDLYLNRVYFGAGAYGVEAAAQRYFGKSARQVTLAEAGLLAGLVKSPSRLAPTRNPDGAERRAQIVLAAMADAGFVSEAAAKTAIVDPPRIAKPMAGGSGNYVADWVMDVLNDLVGRVEQDIIVDTTIDPVLQTAADRALAEELAQKGEKYAVGQGALVAMTPDGAVRALVGGKSYGESQFNRAVAAKRQPGSAFKPFVYLAALERGLTPDTLRDDRPIDLKGWRPENYGREYFGPVTLTRALALSLNTVSVRLTLEVGPKAVVRTAHRLGITSKLDPNASIALGTSEVSVLELVQAYAPFANGGVAAAAHVVERVRTVSGKTLYRARPPAPLRVIDERPLAMLNGRMQETLASGTARKAELPGWRAGGKTGTSQDFRDAWFVGYTGRLVTGVWLGNDDNAPTRKTTGSGLPVDIWSRFMKAAHRGQAPTDLPGGAGAPGGGGGGWLSAAPVPPAPIPAASAPAGGSASIDGWLLDKLFGKR
jgi:penicillin-binding protein 1A